MRYIVFLYLLFAWSRADLVQLFKGKGNNPTRKADGIEFDSISRSSLLQILSAFEEYVQSQVGKNGKAIFTADFANNKYTRPYVYPKMTKNH